MIHASNIMRTGTMEREDTFAEITQSVHNIREIGLKAYEYPTKNKDKNSISKSKHKMLECTINFTQESLDDDEYSYTNASKNSFDNYIDAIVVDTGTSKEPALFITGYDSIDSDLSTDFESNNDKYITVEEVFTDTEDTEGIEDTKDNEGKDVIKDDDCYSKKVDILIFDTTNSEHETERIEAVIQKHYQSTAGKEKIPTIEHPQYDRKLSLVKAQNFLSYLHQNQHRGKNEAMSMITANSNVEKDNGVLRTAESIE
mmetsp:Transcript_11748/g.13060  ORF Transcript_11748/g.13060 Transcript_11748/m.13060 type:complete len:257 (-) Transcript_11748:502-1272(-)